MPTYDFQCPDGHDFERFYRTISAAPAEAECPICGKKSQRKVSGGAGLVFKGSGFYITDYGKDGKKAEREAATKPAEGAKSEGASKPASTESSSSPTPAKDSGSTGSSSPKSE
jgi:putative FmdB family regulatory protein